MNITIRKFQRSDIPKKVEWINNPENNRFLHYDIPLKIDKTKLWYEKNKNNANRYDAVIEVDGVPCGTIGLLNIDKKNHKAEYYIAMGEVSFKGRGVSTKASMLLLDYAFCELGLNRVYLFTEVDNLVAQHLFEKVGFIKEGRIAEDIISNGKYVDRFIYGICKNRYLERN